MKLKIRNAVIIDGKRYAAGAEFDAPNPETARHLVKQGHAEEVRSVAAPPARKEKATAKAEEPAPAPQPSEARSAKP